VSVLSGIHILSVFKIGNRCKAIWDRFTRSGGQSSAVGNSLALDDWARWSAGRIRVLVRVLGVLKSSRVDEVGIFGEFNMDEVQRALDIFCGDDLVAGFHGREKNI
jgi:hypothetical protein